MSINLGQPSVQFLPLSELFVSAAESFIIKGSWFAAAMSLPDFSGQLMLW